jgi:hypothetical protein
MILGVPEAAEPGGHSGSAVLPAALPLPVVDGRPDDPVPAGRGNPEDAPVLGIAAPLDPVPVTLLVVPPLVPAVPVIGGTEND